MGCTQSTSQNSIRAIKESTRDSRLQLTILPTIYYASFRCRCTCSSPGPSPPPAKPESPVSRDKSPLNKKPAVVKYNLSDVSSPQASSHSHLRVLEKPVASRVQQSFSATKDPPTEAKLAEPRVQHRGSDLIGSCSFASKDHTNKVLPATSSTSTHKADPAQSSYRMKLAADAEPSIQKISYFDPAGKILESESNHNLLGNNKLVSSNTELFENERGRSNSLAFKRRRLLSESNQEKFDGQNNLLFQSRASGMQPPSSARKSVSMQHPALERLDPVVGSRKPDGQSQVFSISNNEFQDSPLYRLSRFNKGATEPAKEPQSAHMRVHNRPSSKHVLIPEERLSDSSECRDSEPGEQSFFVDTQRENKLSVNPLKRFSEKIKKNSKGAQEFSADKKYKQLLNLEI